MSNIIVSPGQTVSGVVVGSNTALDVEAGGTAIGVTANAITLESCGEVDVAGLVSDTVISGAGPYIDALYLESRGTAISRRSARCASGRDQSSGGTPWAMRRCGSRGRGSSASGRG